MDATNAPDIQRVRKSESRSIGKLGAHCVEDHRWGKQAETLEWLRVSAIRFYTRNAGESGLKCMMELTVWANAPGLSRTEERNKGFAQSCGYVHRSRVVGHHQVGGTDPLDHLGQRELAGEVEACAFACLGDGCTQRPVLRTAENGTTQLAVVSFDLAEELRVIFNRPALIQPPGSGLEQQPAVAF